MHTYNLRSAATPRVLATPARRFVTLRRKAPAAAVNMRPPSTKPKRGPFPSLSSESFCDFEMGKRRKRCISANNILDSSADTLPTPFQKAPLLSSTPSVLLTAMPRTSNSFVRQMALSEPLEESVVRCAEEDEEVASSRPTTRIALFQKQLENCSTLDKKEDPDASVCKSTINDEAMTLPGRGVQSMRIKLSRGTASLCVLSPVAVSASESQSVIFIGEKPSRPSKENASICCASPELFSDEVFTNVNTDRSLVRQTNQSSAMDSSTLDGSPSAGFLKGISSEKWKSLSRKSNQPVVRLSSEDVSEYLQSKSRKRARCSGRRNTKILQEKSDNSQGVKLCHNSVDRIILPREDLCLSRMQPVVCLSRDSVTKFLDKKLLESLPRPVPPGAVGRCNSSAVQAGMKTPLLAPSVLKSKMQETTGRKVCISGFSTKRWGNHRKKTSKAQQHLSFQDYNEASLLKCMEDIPAGGDLSHSFLLSSSLLTSSFLNSTVIKNLNLSTESLSMRDPQKEHQRWARLRAALSLHRKKKVEAGLPLNHPVHRSNGNVCVTANNSSLLLLSPFQTSLCSEDMTDEEKVLAECQQEKPITFQQCLTEDQLQRCEKIGEGVYGEVFRTLRGEQHVALKVIPIEGSQKVNGEYQKSFAEILPEIIISKELSLLSAGEKNTTSGFIKLHSAHCVQGSYPSELLSAWDEFEDEKGTENERPDLFDEEQLFMILEFEFGGDDLERMSCKLPSISVSRSILHQVTAALAVAEEELRFEHRDLHWGNILIEGCSDDTLSASLQGETFHIRTAGVQVKIIDYTLSRLDKDGLTVFCDLSTDEELFLGKGDLQFDVYRSMREENENTWSLYRPHSNVLWLHYLSDKLLSEVQYVRKPTTAAHRKELRQLRDFRKEVRQFSSAADVLWRSKLFN
ncbi:serine/threonine-protein kinase haspin isoform X2 [Hyperolius riggenbachi]|uniref:serine/threonine-protein kinase haspin isoform X2 n=1 Tax=Hyperolius riggenbachi TaxID=752182 RepID=UPI0035A2FE24